MQPRDPLPWLLEPDNPSVRYLALQHLLDLPEDDADVLAARAAIADSPVARRILSKQAPGGHWGDPTSPYQPKYKASYWTLMVLGLLGLSREDPRVAGAAEHIFTFQGPEGGFRERTPEGARREYEAAVRRAERRGKKPPHEEAHIADLLHQSVLSCLTGNVAAALLRLGYTDDPRLWRAVDWLVEVQNADGGWLCPYWKGHLRDTHACFYGSICPLEALAEIPPARRAPQVQTAADRAAEFLLVHRLYKADHHDFEVINEGWLKLAFPWFYGYNILRGLWTLARLGVRDERMDDAIEVLLQKRNPDGTWPLESTPYGRMQANLEKKGEPSKWVTLYALWALRVLNAG